MAHITIREGSAEEVQGFALYNADNDGTIEVATDETGAIVGFIQRDGAYIRFLESSTPGAGRAMVEYLKARCGDWIQACNVSCGCADFWERMGFEKDGRSGERPGEHHYEWYAEEAE